MTGTLDPPIPKLGSKVTTADPSTVESFEDLRDALNNILNSDNTVTGFEKYHQLAEWYGELRVLSVAATYFPCMTAFSAGAYYGGWTFEDNNSNISGFEEARGTVPFFYLEKADFEIPGRTPKLRLKVQHATNAVKAAVKFTYGLYPVSYSGGERILKVTLGTVVAGSQIEFNEPAASTIVSKNSGDFTLPADGAYVLGLVTNATMPEKSRMNASAQLQLRPSA